MGIKTFGKGSVQTVVPLKDGSAIRLTTSKYYTPSGRSIHGEGIVPDVVADEPPETGGKPEDVFERIKPPEHPEHAPTPRAIDRQLQRAIDLLRGLKVFTEQTGQKA